MESNTPKELIELMDNIDYVSNRLSSNKFIKEARESFTENIGSLEFADDEQAKMIAQYNAQVSLGALGEITKIAKEWKQIDLLVQEQERNVKYAKYKNRLIQEQIRTENIRQRDFRMGIGIKKASLDITVQQARFEEARTKIATTSNNQNAYMKKADYMVQQLQALASDDDITISGAQLQAVKDAIDAIPVEKIEYNSEVSKLNLDAISFDEDGLYEIEDDND